MNTRLLVGVLPPDNLLAALQAVAAVPGAGDLVKQAQICVRTMPNRLKASVRQFGPLIRIQDSTGLSLVQVLTTAGVPAAQIPLYQQDWDQDQVILLLGNVPDALVAPLQAALAPHLRTSTNPSGGGGTWAAPPPGGTPAFAAFLVGMGGGTKGLPNQEVQSRGFDAGTGTGTQAATATDDPTAGTGDATIPEADKPLPAVVQRYADVRAP
ncbi:MAG TPA: hypothetical protein VKY74_12225, partial [Chloroflexia bacterium]|nr:hypothetical protein [Chloroflexia bacterium]